MDLKSAKRELSVLEAAVEAEKELCCKDCLDRAAELELVGELISALGYGFG